MRRGPGGRKFFFLSFFVNFSSLFFVSLAFVLEKKKKQTTSKRTALTPPGAYSIAIPRWLLVRNASLNWMTCGWQKLEWLTSSRSTY